ncbi:hypothetical protein DFJ77DRAFT_267958 [Powellomyces hirtus]|nr:hypothetical protein DFJ77DRAFT_267958 [Powellomyces hirtus]
MDEDDGKVQQDTITTAASPPAENTAETADKGDESESNFKPGDVVWAKIRGFPWWPSRVSRDGFSVEVMRVQQVLTLCAFTRLQVEDEDDLQEWVKKVKKPHCIPVLFCQSRDYGWIAPKDVKPFTPNRKLYAAKNKTPAFLKALEEADDPSLLDDQAARIAATAAVLAARATPKRRKSSVSELPSSRKKTKKENEDTPDGKHSKNTAAKEGSTAKKTKKRLADEDDEGAEHETTPAKKKRLRKSRSSLPADGDSGDDSKGDTEDTEAKEKARSKKHHHNEDDPPSHERQLQKLLKIRSKLQNFMREVKENDGKLDDEAFEAAQARLKDLDEFPLTFQLIKESKVGKLVKLLCKLRIEDDRFKIIQTSSDLMQKLKLQFGAEQSEEMSVTPAPTNGEVTDKIEVEAPAATHQEDADAEQPSPSNDASKATQPEVPLTGAEDERKDVARASSSTQAKQTSGTQPAAISDADSIEKK